MKYHALFVNFEKAAKFEIVICFGKPFYYLLCNVDISQGILSQTKRPRYSGSQEREREREREIEREREGGMEGGR